MNYITRLNPTPVKLTPPQYPQIIVVQTPPGFLQTQQNQQGQIQLQGSQTGIYPFIDRMGRNPLFGVAVIFAGMFGSLIVACVATKAILAIIPAPPAYPIGYPATSPCTRSLQISASSSGISTPLLPRQSVTPQLGVQVTIAEVGYQATFPAGSVWAEYAGTEYFGEPAQIQRIVNARARLDAIPEYKANLPKTTRVWLGQNVLDMAGNGGGGGTTMDGSAIILNPYIADDDQVLAGYAHENDHDHGKGHAEINGRSVQLANALGFSPAKIPFAP